MSSSNGRLAAGLAATLVVASGLPGCVSKSDVQLVQGEVALLRAETMRRDSTRAAQLGEVLQIQRQIMDSLTVSRRAVGQLKGDISSDLYNIQQQLVQLQELTGQSQQRLSELRTQLEARGAEIETTAPPGGAPAPGDTAQPAGGPSASADQMYEASLAQLRRGSTGTARLGLREMLRNIRRASARPTRCISSARATRRRIRIRPRRTTRRWWTGSPRPPEPRRPCTTWGSSPSAGRTAPRPRRLTSAWCRSTLSRTRPRWPAIA